MDDIWKNVDFKLGVIKIRETRVRGEEGRPKTKGSVRDIVMLPPVIEALRDQRRYTMGRSEYVFLNGSGRPLLPNSINYHVWKPALKKAGLKPRSLYQTRHTFATLMLDGREHPGWVFGSLGASKIQTFRLAQEASVAVFETACPGESEAFHPLGAWVHAVRIEW